MERMDFDKLSHAAQCAELYVRNSCEIYRQYTEPLTDYLTRLIKESKGREYRLDDATARENLVHVMYTSANLRRAVGEAVRLVKEYDGVTPTAEDIRQVCINYAHYLVENVDGVMMMTNYKNQ